MKTQNVLKILIPLVVISLGVVLIYGVTTGKSEVGKSPKQKMPPVVQVETAKINEISFTLELTGSAEPYKVARLASPAEGPVHDIHVREGDLVKAGSAMLSIGRKEGIDALITSLREELKKEEDNLSRTKQLVESGAFAGEQLDNARASHEKIRALLVKAEETAQDYTIEAPWEGVVSRLLVKDGEFVSPRASLLEMYDPESMVIQASVPEKHAAMIATGLRVDVKLDAYPGDIIKGRIERIYPYLDPRLRTRTMEVVLDKQVLLLPGMFARLKVFMKTVNDSVVVPAEAIVTTPKGQMVFVLEDGKALGHLVQTGIEEGSRIQILTGIQPGDKVIVAGNEKIKDGTSVRIQGSEKPNMGNSQNNTGQGIGRRNMMGGGR